MATPAPEESAIDIEQANVAQPPASLGPAQQAGETVSALAAEEVQDSADAEALGSRAADTAREALGVPGQLSAGEQADQPSQMATRQQLGRSEVHAQALIRQAEDPATSSDERRAIAFALLEIGRNDDAERIFQSLAAAAGPISPYTQTLNWLWGPRPDGQELQWMMEAARQAPVAERVGWINRILTAGAPREAASLAEELLRQSNDAGLLDVAIRAHIVLGDRQNVDRLLLPAVDRIDGAAMAEYFARLAEEAGADYAASILYEKAARLEPQRNELLGRAGILAGRLSQAERARPMLEEYVGRGGQSPEASFALAEYNFEDGKFTRARAGFEAVIGASNRAPSNPTLLRLKAPSLLRLRRETEAYDVFVKLIAMAPADLELRADAGAALLNAGRPNEAARVLRYRNGNTTKSRRR